MYRCVRAHAIPEHTAAIWLHCVQVLLRWQVWRSLLLHSPGDQSPIVPAVQEDVLGTFVANETGPPGVGTSLPTVSSPLLSYAARLAA